MDNHKVRSWFVALTVALAVAALVSASGTAEAYSRARSHRPAANCSRTSVGFTPLNDLATGTYQGYEGGLYLDGDNLPSASYQSWGQTRTQAVQPLDANGQPDPNGRIVLLSIGMSNTTMEFSAFKRLADADPSKNPKLTIVDGAQGGQDAEIIKNPNAQFWTIVDQRLVTAVVTDNQVQVAWLKEAIAGENEAFPTDAQHLRNDLSQIVQIMQTRYPHLQVIYLASRIYAGYATTTLNPEPYAYESGFAVKWLIEAANVSASSNLGVWLAWGPYMWADGIIARSDGLQWFCSDFQSDGTHPSASGQQKVANMLLNFFKTDKLAKLWFLSSSGY
jgi:lysophospholipase L1-like esterase